MGLFGLTAPNGGRVPLFSFSFPFIKGWGKNGKFRKSPLKTENTQKTAFSHQKPQKHPVFTFSLSVNLSKNFFQLVNPRGHVNPLHKQPPEGPTTFHHAPTARQTRGLAKSELLTIKSLYSYRYR